MRKLLFTLFLLLTLSISLPVDALAGLKVQGNKIVDSAGKTIRLRGVNRSGTEFACIQGNGIFDGPNTADSIRTMKTWKINVVRIPLNEDCWLNINGVRPDLGGSAYQNAIKSFIEAFLAQDVYVIIDLHWTHHGTNKAIDQQPMPNKDHSPDFWVSVANFFKGNNAIIFDLFNEPFPNSNTWDSESAWQCWKNGGSSCQGLAFTAAGMQDLVNAVRSTGADNVLMLGGLAYSNSLAQFNKYAPTDPKKGIAASWHAYNFNYCRDQGCWNQYVLPVSKEYPVVIGELGENDCAHGFIDGLMSWADTNGLSYLGWTWNTWNCKDGPALITSYDGTPTAFGQGLKDHLAK